LIDETQTRYDEMSDHYVTNQEVVPSIKSLEEYDSPKSVEKDEGQGRIRGHHEEVGGITPDTHSSRADGIGENVDDGEAAAHDSKTQASHEG